MSSTVGPTSTRLAAQVPALANPETGIWTVQYSTNESGGRIQVTGTTADPIALEAVRALLVEHAAAFRRGDVKNLRIVTAGLPALQVLADHPGTIRCVVRFTPNGGDLVLLSDDNAVVEAIHQLLASPPPASRPSS